MLPEVSERLNEVREVHVQTKYVRHGLCVEMETVSSQLDLVR